MQLHPESGTQLSGRRLTLVRGAWIVLALLSIGLFSVGVPVRLSQLLTVCHDAACPELRLSPPDVVVLRQVGLVIDHYAAYFIALEVSFGLAFAAVGAALFWRRPDDWMVVFVSLTLVTFGLSLPPPMRTLAGTQPAWRMAVVFVQTLGTGAFFALFYLFPDGRFVPRWTRIPVVLWIAFSLIWLFFPVANPFTWTESFGQLAFLGGWFGMSIVAQIYRYMRVSGPVQRQQTKWIVYGVTAPALGGLIAFVILPWLSGPGFPQLLLDNVLSILIWVISLAVIPLAITISILRYRLWEIDVLINRTLNYGLLTGVLALIYVSFVVVLQGTFRTLIGQESQLAIVASTLSVVALFTPVRRRVQAIVDRRFYRRKYNAAQTLTAFSATVRDETDLDKLTDELLAVVEKTMQPARVSLWLRDSNAIRQGRQEAREKESFAT